jgi:YVTN family beta-propeller protein
VLVEFTMENFLGVGGRGGQESSELLAGERALVKFRVTDAATGAPLSGLRPSAWLDLPLEIRGFSGKPLSCEEQVQGYLGGTLMAKPTVDLNSFFILALNDDPSISVIDPTVDVAGMTQLFALIQLSGPGEDWVLSADQNRLFVTLPASNQVAVAEMDGFDVAMHLDGGPNPGRIAIQPDQRYVWVANDGERAGEGGVTVIDPQSLSPVTFIPTGAGHHELAFSADSRFAFVTNSESGTLSVIDTGSLQEVAEANVGRQPLALDVSEANGAIYVADAATGKITVVDGESFEPLAEIEGDAGLAALAFAPGGRWAFAANPLSGAVSIIDGESNEVTHVAQVGGGPDQVSFSEGAAYIRARDAALVYVIPLADLAPDKELELGSVPVGTLPAGRFPSLPRAGAVSAAGRQGAVVIANPVDDQVYFLPEGSTSPSGSFQGHTLRPRAVMVVDRSLREDAPGVYTGRLRVPASGDYIVALMLNQPEMLIHCFEFYAKPNPALDEAAQPVPELTLLNDEGALTAGQPFDLRFSLTDPETGEGLADLQDVLILAAQTAGNWNTRQVAGSLGDGVYEVKLTVPNAGLYTIFFAVPSLGLDPGQLPTLNLQAAAG